MVQSAEMSRMNAYDAGFPAPYPLYAQRRTILMPAPAFGRQYSMLGDPLMGHQYPIYGEPVMGAPIEPMYPPPMMGNPAFAVDQMSPPIVSQPFVDQTIVGPPSIAPQYMPSQYYPAPPIIGGPIARPPGIVYTPHVLMDEDEPQSQQE